MRIVWICILFAVAATAFLSGGITNTAVSVATARKLIKDEGDVGLEDYGPVDPSPSSKRVQPKPIQHGTPLMPYIPRHPPPPPPLARV